MKDADSKKINISCWFDFIDRKNEEVKENPPSKESHFHVIPGQHFCDSIHFLLKSFDNSCILSCDQISSIFVCFWIVESQEIKTLWAHRQT